MIHPRRRFIQTILSVVVLMANQRTASYVPSSRKMLRKRLVRLPFVASVSEPNYGVILFINSKSDSNEDEKQEANPIPANISDNSNTTQIIVQLSTLEMITLQQKYEALLLNDSGEHGLSSSTSNADSNREGNRSRYEPQNLLNAHSRIPSEFVTILKDQSLWSNDTNVVHTPAMLTSLERKRRVLEIELLQNLMHDDETVHQLWLLWFTERGNQGNATKQLYDATTYSNDPNTWDKAEAILRDLILHHGIYWVEPMNRLATLYYLQGKYQQSIDLCKVVLHVKPWHFGALSGMVGLYIQTNDLQQAKVWSEKRLPSSVPVVRIAINDVWNGLHKPYRMRSNH
jgi:hypothetical protein